MRAVRLIVAAALVLAVTLLAGANVAPVTLDYVVGRVEVPLAAALFGALVLGVVLGGVAMYGHHLRVRWRGRHVATPARPASLPPEPVHGAAPGHTGQLSNAGPPGPSLPEKKS